MQRRAPFLLVLLGLCFGAWFLLRHHASPIAEAEPTPQPPRTDEATRARELDIHVQQIQTQADEMARLEVLHRQRDRAIEAGEQARLRLQSQKNDLWGTVIQTNWQAYQALRHSSVGMDVHCTLCDGSGLMSFCILCDGNGQCPSCHGTGTTSSGEICPVCLGKRKCVLCFGQGRMPCPFCDDGIIYANLRAPSSTLPLLGSALSRPSVKKEFSRTAPQASAPGTNSRPPVTADKDVAPMARPTVLSGLSHQQLQIAAVFLLAGLILLPRICRWLGVFLNRCNPWGSAVSSKLPSNISAEQQAFARIVTTFQAGPPQTDDPSDAGATSRAGARLETFFRTAPELLASLRTQFPEIGRETDPGARQRILGKLLQQVAVFKTRAACPEVLPAWQLAATLEGLLQHLNDKPGEVTVSALRTAADAVALLETLCRPGLKPDLATVPPARLLGVANDSECRTTLALTLKGLFTQPDLAPTGAAGHALAERQPYDIIFLDMDAPGADSGELCAQIQQTAQNRQTPVVLISGRNDSESSVTSIAKPLVSFELAVKALTTLLRSRLLRCPEFGAAADCDAVPSLDGAALPFEDAVA